MARGFVYLAAVVDWFSRRVLSWRLSITMQADFCVEAVEEAFGRFGKPEIFNTDQGSQFTSIDFTKVLLAKDIKISMDGKGAWRDECLHRAAVEVGEIREGRSPGLSDRQQCPGVDRPIPRLLQWATPAFEPGPENPGPRLLQPAASRCDLNPAAIHLSSR